MHGRILYIYIYIYIIYNIGMCMMSITEKRDISKILHYPLFSEYIYHIKLKEFMVSKDHSDTPGHNKH